MAGDDVKARDDYPNLASIAGAKPTARPAAVYSWTQDQIREALDEIDRLRYENSWLRAANDAWMNGVAEAVEPLGYDREAACGPADLLPGLVTLVENGVVARRACLVLRAAVRDAARYLSRVDFAELNDVMFEAERRGW